MTPCPHCGRPMIGDKDALTEAVNAANLTASEFRLADALAWAFPRPVTRDSLISAVWSIHNEPAYASADLNAHISRVRRKLKPHGWTIASVRFLGYRLSALENGK